tara:strand:- start:67 stop:321 length:255 start_codon:yes stop_codon:yes gene_type:complete
MNLLKNLLIIKTFKKNIFKYILGIFFISISFTSNAYAYLDPGTGGLIVQILIASLIGVGVFFKNIKIKFLEFFKKNKKENDEDK